jgi:hypothetical protein
VLEHREEDVIRRYATYSPTSFILASTWRCTGACGFSVTVGASNICGGTALTRGIMGRLKYLYRCVPLTTVFEVLAWTSVVIFTHWGARAKTNSILQLSAPRFLIQPNVRVARYTSDEDGFCLDLWRHSEMATQQTPSTAADLPTKANEAKQAKP